MNSNDEADTSDSLKRLRKVAAPASFESHLYRRIRSLPSRNRYLNWFLRPIPVATAVALGALVVAAYFAIPYYLSTSSAVPAESPIRVPPDRQSGQLPGQTVSGKGQLAVPFVEDSLSSDSASAAKNDVNTSKLP